MGDEEAFSRIAKRQLEGVMFHAALAQWFGAASVWGKGMRDVQLGRAKEEFAGYLKTLSVYEGTAIAPLSVKGADPKVADILKPEWAEAYPEVHYEEAQALIIEGMQKWLDWEKATLAEYQAIYSSSSTPEQGADMQGLYAGDLMEGVRREIRAIYGWMCAHA